MPTMISPAKYPLIYITRDIERALGLPLDTPCYFIISNFSDFANSIAKNRKNILLIKEKKMLDTWELLQHPQVKEFINSLPHPDPLLIKERGKQVLSPCQKEDQNEVIILVFKNTPQIEKICAENNWKLLNPPAELSNKVEEKISQISWLGPLKKYLPKYSVQKCKNINFTEKPFILQFNRSHTGSGTILINSEKILENIKNKFPEREARIAEYIPGPLFTNNNVVTKNKILHGNISYQITGLKPFTNLPFSTIGNDWALPHKILTKKQILQYKKIATDVGLRLKKAVWKGLFGIDVVVDERNGKLYLLEINCRQPASTTYESQLQERIRNTKSTKLRNNELTTFEAHLLALLDVDLKNKKLIEIKDGSQIIQRVNQSAIKNLKSKINKLSKQFKIIKYNNTEQNSDLLRIQNKMGIMKKHNEFNNIGNKIIKILKNK